MPAARNLGRMSDMIFRQSIVMNAGAATGRSGSRAALAIVGVLAALMTGGCAVVAVSDAAVSVAATTVRVGANVLGGAVDVARAGVRAVTGSEEPKK